MLLATIGVFTLPGCCQVGNDPFAGWEWRGPATAIVGLAALIQSADWRAAVGFLPVIVMAFLAAGQDIHGRWSRVGSGLLSLVLTLVFAPLSAGLWLGTRDVRRAFDGS
ncbi:hypothetical protein DQ392_14570 [Streptomyces reniochalinae]|uniref:Uncharacterized protein n=1 Tax=Streptomyces reniochalinae TaxID=2250578 RepID=A0A367EKH5_9ACTN|nr:hypothetical protein DQ392_14570 [Streptomyces reniochalinae]